MAVQKNCKNCGSDNIVIKPTSTNNIHAGEAKCGDCNSHIQWVSKYDCKVYEILGHTF